MFVIVPPNGCENADVLGAMVSRSSVGIGSAFWEASEATCSIEGSRVFSTRQSRIAVEES